MNKTLATFGLLALAGALSLCDLCGSGSRVSAAPGGLVSTAYAAPVSAPVANAPAQGGASPQAPAQVAVQPAAAPRTVTLTVKGMTCGGCVLGTRKVLTRLPGVATADVRYDKGTAVVTYDPAQVTVAQMVAAIKTLGYTATPAAG